jgi:Trk K+ transport system NAD-binding subunit
MRGEWIDRHIPEVGSLSRRHRLVVVYAVGLVSIVLLYSFLYNFGMRTLEGDQHSLFRSFQTVVETMTTTGYGADSPWESWQMNVFVVWMQLTGIVIGFATLRVLIIPLFQRTPVDLTRGLSPKDDHVVVCEYERDSAVFLDELERLGIDYVLIESDVEMTERLSADGYEVIDGDPEQGEDLDRALIDDAQVVVTDARDRNVSIILTALRRNEDLSVLSVTETPTRDQALSQVGADAVFAPHAMIGRRLAHKVGASVEPPQSTDAIVGEDVEIREVIVRRASPLHGRRMRDTPFAAHPQVNLVAAWIDGELRIPPQPDDVVTPNTVLLVVGPEGALADVRDSASGVRKPREHTEVIVAGGGVGGSAAGTALPDDVDVTTIDRTDGSEVDVVGDVRDPSTLREAGIEDATALVVTVDEDATALLAVALARTLTDQIEILVRVSDTNKTLGALDAGADYALSIQRVTARLLAREIHGEDVLTPVNQIRVVRAASSPFAGQTLGEAKQQHRREHGYSIIGVQRDGAFHSDDATAIREGDTVLIAGTDEAIQVFELEVSEE